MASLWKHPNSRYWTACYTSAAIDPRSGRRKQVKRSTKTKNKDDAMRIALEYEALENAIVEGTATAESIRSVLNDLISRLTGQPTTEPSVRDWLARYLKRKDGTVSDDTMIRLGQVIDDFLEFLGPKADSRLALLSTDDLVAFRNKLRDEGRSAKTVNLILKKFLARPIRLAFEEGILVRNPIPAIEPLKGTTTEKGTFSLEHMTRLLATAKGDWRGLILAGFYTGARLGDLVRLKWDAVDLAERTITFRARKTDSKIKIPIHPQLHEHLLTLASNDRADAPLFPTLYDKQSTGRSGLSTTFKAIMTDAGIDAGVARAREGAKGRSTSKLSFHSLRHSFNSVLANAGVPAEIRQLLTGHSSLEMNAAYTHHEFARVQAAIEHLPRFSGGEVIS